MLARVDAAIRIDRAELPTKLRERLRREFASTLPRFDVMSALERHGDVLKMSALSDALMVSNGNVTGIVDWLVRHGLVERVRQPGDKRVSLVRLTEKGREEFARQAAAHEAWVSALLAGFDGDEAERLNTCLERAARGMEETP